MNGQKSSASHVYATRSSLHNAFYYVIDRNVSPARGGRARALARPGESILPEERPTRSRNFGGVNYARGSSIRLRDSAVLRMRVCYVTYRRFCYERDHTFVNRSFQFQYLLLSIVHTINSIFESVTRRDVKDFRKKKTKQNKIICRICRNNEEFIKRPFVTYMHKPGRKHLRNKRYIRRTIDIKRNIIIQKFR